MNVVNERKELVRVARRARARQGLVRSVDISLRALFYALCASLAALIAAKVFGLSIPVRESAIGLAAVVGLAGLIALYDGLASHIAARNAPASRFRLPLSLPAGGDWRESRSI